MKFQGQDILSTKQFDKDGLLALFAETKEMEERGMSDALKGKVMASIFYEPSTRTRFSFETACLRAGGKLVSNADMKTTSSAKKRETLEDTGRVLSEMVDVIVARHPDVGSVAKIAEGSKVPVLNAGDGPGEHPTQGLLDLYTVWKEKGTLDGLTWGMVGDLKNGRVPHSQADLLRHFDVDLVCVAPSGLEMPEDYKFGDTMESEDLAKVIGEMDVIGMTRVQAERFKSEEEYRKYAGTYVLDEEMMKLAKEDSVVLHPLPRVDEIAVGVDSDKRAKYFDQVKNGVYVRMALLKKVLNG